MTTTAQRVISRGGRPFRPSTAPAKAKVRVNVDLPADLDQQLRLCAERHGRSLTDVMQLALAHYLAMTREESAA